MVPQVPRRAARLTWEWLPRQPQQQGGTWGTRRFKCKLTHYPNCSKLLPPQDVSPVSQHRTSPETTSVNVRRYAMPTADDGLHLQILTRPERAPDRIADVNKLPAGRRGHAA
jgi:hypothetical protein